MDNTTGTARRGRPLQVYRVADTAKAPNTRVGTRTEAMAKHIAENPDGFTSADLEQASGAPRTHCNDYLWRLAERSYIERIVEGTAPQSEEPSLLDDVDVGDGDGDTPEE